MTEIAEVGMKACPSDALFDASAFGQRIKAKLKAERMSFREAAPAVPCSVASLNRAARGLAPDVENYLRISRWLTGARQLDPRVSAKEIAVLVGALEQIVRRWDDTSGSPLWCDMAEDMHAFAANALATFKGVPAHGLD